MANKKIWLSKHLTISSLSNEALVEYYVEAKEGRRWVTVGGPYPDRDSANEFAQQYSKNNPNVEVQVVVFQG